MSVCSAACKDDLPLELLEISSVTNKNQVNTLQYPLVQSIRNSYPDKMGYHFTDSPAGNQQYKQTRNQQKHK